MSLRFAPVPYAALDLVPDIGIVADLYRRAHLCRWRPLSVTSRSLATSWGCSTDRVWTVLELLHEAGLLKLEKGARRKPSMVTVYDPQTLEIDESGAVVESSQRINQGINQGINQNEPGRTGGIDEEQSKDPPRDPPRDPSPLYDPDPETLTPDLDDPPLPPPGGQSGPVLVHPVEEAERDPYATWRRLNDVYGSLPGCKRLRSPSKGLGLCLQRIAETHGYDDGRDMLLWMAYASDCPKASSLDEGGHRTLGTVGKVSHVEGYWPCVAAWVKRGRVGAPGGKPARPTGGRYRNLNDYDPSAGERRMGLRERLERQRKEQQP